MNNISCVRGDIVWVHLPIEGSNGHVQGNNRVALIVSNDMCNRFSPVISVIPLTKAKKKPLPTHINIETKYNRLKYQSTGLAEQILTISKDDVLEAGFDEVTDDCLEKVEDALKNQLSL